MGKEGKPCLRIEAVCDIDLWIWSFQFGIPGVYNDLNILQTSSLITKVLAGVFPPAAPKYRIGSQWSSWYYYLADDIYPKLKIFIQTLRDPETNKQAAFCLMQEAARKSGERVFGVLFRQFMTMAVASEHWSTEYMTLLAKTCVTIHNMNVEVRREWYSGDGVDGRTTQLTEQRNGANDEPAPVGSTEVTEWLVAQSGVDDRVKSRAEHDRLQAALVDHAWQCRGQSA